jgi:hypothetical protein
MSKISVVTGPSYFDAIAAEAKASGNSFGGEPDFSGLKALTTVAEARQSSMLWPLAIALVVVLAAFAIGPRRIF